VPDSLVIHAQRKRRNAGCRRTVKKPLLETRLTVTGCAALQHYDAMVAGTLRRRVTPAAASLLSPLHLWGALLRGFAKAKPKKGT
jgi:hypothetical protein